MADVLENEHIRSESLEEENIFVKEGVPLVTIILVDPRMNSLLSDTRDLGAPNPTKALARGPTEQNMHLSVVRVQFNQVALGSRAKRRAEAIPETSPLQPCLPELSTMNSLKK